MKIKWTKRKGIVVVYFVSEFNVLGAVVSADLLRVVL